MDFRSNKDYYHCREEYPDGLTDLLLPREEFAPFPKYGQKGWEEIDEATRKAIVAYAENCMTQQVPYIPASAYMKYHREGDRSNDGLVGTRRRNMLMLALAECIEQKGRFLDALIDHIWVLCEETTWVLPAHNWQGLEGGWKNDSTRLLPDVQDTQIDIVSSETGACLAWIYYLLKEKLEEISYLIPERMEYELTRRILDPFYKRRDAWWMSASIHNWHIWCTFNCLAVVLLMEPGKQKRAMGAELALRYVRNYLDEYPQDGANGEGVAYWNHSGGSMYSALKLMKLASNGKIDWLKREKVKRIGSFMYNMHIDGSWFFNHSYCAAKHRGATGLRPYFLGMEIGDEKLVALGEEMCGDFFDKTQNPMAALESNAFNCLEYLFRFPKEPKNLPIPHVAYAWCEDLQCMTARENPGSSKGFFVGAKGANGDPDRHLDGGEFVLYLDGNPVYIDMGPATYSRAVIDNRYRYKHYSAISTNHNTLTINGLQQNPAAAGRTESVSSDDGKVASIQVDLSKAYDPAAGVEHCVRTVALDRSASAVTVSQTVKCAAEAQISMHLVTPVKPELKENQVLTAGTCLRYDSKVLRSSVEEIDFDKDPTLVKNWGEHLYRVTLTAHTDNLETAFVITHE